MLAIVATRVAPAPAHLLATMLSMAGLILLVALWADQSAVGQICHEFVPVPMILCVYELVGRVLTSSRPRTIDERLSSIDAQYFGSLELVWRGALGRPPWLTCLLSVAYLCFFFIPILMAVALYRADRPRDLEMFGFTIELTAFATFAGYLLFPAAGPAASLTQPPALVGGSMVATYIQAGLHAAQGNPFDAFPSGHTSAGLTYLALGWKMLPRWKAPLSGVVSLIIFSTVYLRAHYVIDLLAGAVLSLACLTFSALIAPDDRKAPGPISSAA